MQTAERLIEQALKGFDPRELIEDIVYLTEAPEKKKKKKAKSELVKELEQRDDVDDPEALAAWIGHQKYGSEYMASASRSSKG